MSLFDSIKYPITEEFRNEDLLRLPDEIFNPWLIDIKVFVKFTREGIFPRTNRRGAVSYLISYGYYEMSMDYQMLSKYFLVLLKERIQEYDVLD
jgi:hypothetical protein